MDDNITVFSPASGLGLEGFMNEPNQVKSKSVFKTDLVTSYLWDNTTIVLLLSYERSLAPPTAYSR